MNFGLVKQVIESFRRFSILRLGRTYSSLTLADVAQRTHSDSTKSNEIAGYLQWLLQTGQLDATLEQRGADQGTWVLHFREELQGKSEAQQLRELKETQACIQNLSTRVAESDQKLGLNKDYLEWNRRSELKGKDSAGLPEFQDMIDDMVQDEDMMVEG